jgi:virginiamycin B lyase
MNSDIPAQASSSKSYRAWLAVASSIAIVAAVAWTYSSSRRVEVAEFPMVSAKDIPAVIAVGPDDSIWFTIDFAAAIGRVHGGKVQRYSKPTVSGEPVGLAVAPDGAAWFTDSNARCVSRINVAGDITSVNLGTPIARLGKLAIAADGAVWFAEASAYSVTRLKDGKLERHVIDSVRGDPLGVAIGSEGSVWATLQSANQLMRIAPDGTMSSFDIPTPGSSPGDVAVDSKGVVWFLEFRGNKVGRFSDGRFDEISVGEESAGLTGLATGLDDSVWFGMLRKGSLGRLRDGKVTEFKLPRERARPYSLALDKSGNVWYTDIGGYIGMLKSDAAKK